MIGDVIDKQIKQKWAETTTLRNTTSYRADPREWGVDSDHLSHVREKSLNPKE